MKFFLMVIFIVPAFSQGHYPLQIGNVWQYRDSYDTMHVVLTSRVVRDTTLSNGYQYVLILTNSNSEGPFVRQDGSKVFFYTHNPTVDSLDRYVEELMYNFSKTTGDTVRVTVLSTPNGTDTITIRVVDDKILNVFGKLRRTWTFYESSKRTSGYVIRRIADSVGMIYTAGEGGIAYSLWGAIINGAKYGTITDVKDFLHFPPTEYRLYQNYPNPFNPSTMINYQLPEDNYVTLKVYDLLGREVATIVNEKKNAGFYSVPWNGKSLSSGVYFYRLQAGSYSGMKKLVLLK